MLFPHARVFPILMVLPLACLAWERSDYVKEDTRNFSVRPSLQYADLTLEADSADMVYSPNNPTRLCLQLAYKGFSLSGGLALPIDKENGKRVDSHAFDLIFHQYYNHLVADIYYQNYRGFGADGKDSTWDLPNLHAYHVGTTALYVFSGKRFSYQAAFDLTQRQLRSTGTWLLGGGMHYSRFSGAPDSIAGFMNFTNWHAGLNGGYAYNWVFYPSWLLHGSATLGLHGSNERISKWLDERFRLEEVALLRMGLNHNGPNWGYGLSVIVHALFMHRGDVEFSSTVGQIDLFVMRRFALD